MSRVTVNDSPAEASAFVGRHQELRRIREILAGSRLVTLTGVGGVGKTRLALEAAEQVRPVFPDGVCVVGLAAVEDESLLVYAVAQAVGWQTLRRAPSAGDLGRYLADRNVLLVLDNCEHLVDACAGLVATVLRSAPGVKLLATSRRSLGVAGEQIMVVPAMAVPAVGASPGSDSGGDSMIRCESVALFLERARAARSDFALTPGNRTSVARLCRRLEGLPLALELAAARVASVPVEEIAQHVADQCVPEADDCRAPGPRHESLHSLIAWSFDLLAPSDRTVFTRLCVFPADGFDLAAAEQVCAGEGLATDVLLALLNLVDQSLVVYDPHTGGRYHLLETVRRFGLDRLVRAGEADLLHRRHRDHYQQLAVQADEHWFGPDQLAWTGRFRAELANWRTALAHALDHPDDAQSALRIAVALVPYWRMTGMVSEGRRWLENALTAHPRPGFWRAPALWRCAWFSTLQGDYDIAARLLGEGRALAGRFEDPASLVGVLLMEGVLAGLREDHAACAALLREAEELARAVGDAGATAIVLTERSAMQPEPETAGLEEALRLCEEHGELWWRGTVLRTIGWKAWRSGDPRRAVAMFNQGLEIERLYGDIYEIGWGLLALCVVATDAGRYREAARLLGAGQGAMRAVGTEPMMLINSLHGPAVREAVGELRRILGEDFSRLVDSGAAVPPAQAADEALGG